MKIKTKVLIPPAVAVLLMLVLGLISLNSLRTAQGALGDVEELANHRIASANRTRTELLEANVGSYRLMIWIADFDEARIKKDAEVILGHIATADKAVQDWQTLNIPATEKQALVPVQEGLVKYRKSVAQAIDMASGDASGGAGMMLAAEKRFIEVSKQLQSIQTSQLAEAESLTNAAGARLNSAITIATIVFFSAVGIATAIALTFARQIVLPLQRAIGVASEISKGNLQNHIETSADDETGDLMRALSAMQRQLNELIGTIAGGATQINETSVTLSGASGQLAQSSAQQSDRVSSVAATVEELAVSISHVSSHVTTTRDTARHAAQAAENGLRMVTEAEKSLNSMTGTISAAADDVKELAESSRQINELANSIREIADQTNLLALNAAIEAARAGESGRGFAVVADEVRKLAEKTGSATTNIKSMLDDISIRTDNSVQTIDNVRVQAQQNVDQIRQLIEPLERIQHGAQRSLSDLEQLTTGVAEQSAASNEVAQHMESIASLTEDNNRAAQNVSHEASVMTALANTLAGAVGSFKVDRTAG